MFVGLLRDCGETFTLPAGRVCARAGCGEWSSEPLLECGPFGHRDHVITQCAVCARLVYGAGFIDREDWGKLDPPLNGEGWKVTNYICEAAGFKGHCQAACYVSDAVPGLAIVAYRGTVTIKGVLQDISIGMPVTAPALKQAISEASSFLQMCEHLHADKELLVTGHSLGGFIAEAVASYHDVPGVCFNSPGPWSPNPAKNMTGPHRPRFEVHLNRDDPLAFAFFPKPENSRHIAAPMWHEGTNHRVCQPYMREIEQMRGVHSIVVHQDRDYVDQMSALYPPDDDIYGHSPNGYGSSSDAESWHQ